VAGEEKDKHSPDEHIPSSRGSAGVGNLPKGGVEREHTVGDLEEYHL
jgi:hypothetical protein